MNETLKVIENRRSVRKYSVEPISQEEKDLILHAAMRAPTAGNMMLYSIVNIEDQSIKDRLAETCDHQPFIAAAPWALLFLADYQRYFDYYQFCEVEAACREKGIHPRRPGEGDLLLACSDALIAAQTAVIAAEALGIGSCYIGDILENAEIHRELFGLPQYTLPITLVVFGKPFAAKNDEARQSPRFGKEFVCFENRYKRLTAEDFVRMMEPSASHNFPNLPIRDAVAAMGKAQYFRKFVADFSVEMERSAKEWIGAWTKKS